MIDGLPVQNRSLKRNVPRNADVKDTNGIPILIVFWPQNALLQK